MILLALVVRAIREHYDDTDHRATYPRGAIVIIDRMGAYAIDARMDY